MTGVILVIDELIDQGVIMQLEPTVILQRITSKGDSITGGTPDEPKSGGMFGSSQQQE